LTKSSNSSLLALSFPSIVGRLSRHFPSRSPCVSLFRTGEVSWVDSHALHGRLDGPNETGARVFKRAPPRTCWRSSFLKSKSPSLPGFRTNYRHRGTPPSSRNSSTPFHRTDAKSRFPFLDDPYLARHILRILALSQIHFTWRFGRFGGENVNASIKELSASFSFGSAFKPLSPSRDDYTS